MHKLRRRIVSDNSAKKARLLHGCNLAFLGLLLCTTLLAEERPPQQSAQSDIRTIERLSYEGQKISSVELAGQPDLNLDEMMPLVAQHGGEEFSVEKTEQTIAALQSTGKFKDVQIELRPEQEGVRVMFVLQPAIYFGMYRFPGAERFPYARLIIAASYVAQEPFSFIDVQKAQASLLTFLRRNGYFQAEVNPEVQIDRPNGLANVNFHVKLNQRAKFGDILIQGTTPDETEHIKRSLRSFRARLKSATIREGKNYSLTRLQNATRFIESHLRSENRLAAQVKLIGAKYDSQTNRADVSFDIQPGPPVQVHVEGARKRRSLLPIYEQNGLTPELIQEGRQNLLNRFRKRGFFDVQVDTETNVRPNGIIILYRVMKGDRKRIENVAFTGNNHFAEDELRQHVSVRTAGFFTNGRYDESSIKTLQAFYQSKGFNQVRVTPEFNAEDRNVIVTFAIEEGPQDSVSTFRLDGNNSVPLKQLAPDGLRLAPGQPFSQKSIDDDRNKIMSYYLEHGYITATFHANAQPSPDQSHKFDVVYEIQEGPQVKTKDVVTIGNQITKDALIDRQTRTIAVGRPMTEREILASESKLYATGVFDWAEVNPRSRITSQEQEEVIVKVHESQRNTILYGFGYEFVNKGGSIPNGTVAVPGLPPVLLPPNFITTEERVQGPRLNFQYTRNNVRGKAETLTLAALYGPLDRRALLSFTNPNFRWTDWTGSLLATAEQNKENPIFNARLAQLVLQLSKPINAKKTQSVTFAYTLSRINLTDLVIPELVPPDDRNTRLSYLSAIWFRDTRDHPLDAHRGTYNTVELDINPAVLGSNVSFGRVLAQSAAYKEMKGIVWANSLRVGFLRAFADSHVPLSQKFFTGGGSTLRGFPLNGAGPQVTISVCSNPAETSTCSPARVPTGGTQLAIFNSELRFPLPFNKHLTFATFYDGGNVFEHIGFSHLAAQWTNSVGFGFRYATPVGPIRVDFGHNLSPIPGISATQIFITLGQAF
jgi:outer membrane protein insertion porin family